MKNGENGQLKGVKRGSRVIVGVGWGITQSQDPCGSVCLMKGVKPIEGVTLDPRLLGIIFN